MRRIKIEHIDPAMLANAIAMTIGEEEFNAMDFGALYGAITSRVFAARLAEELTQSNVFVIDVETEKTPAGPG